MADESVCTEGNMNAPMTDAVLRKHVKDVRDSDVDEYVDECEYCREAVNRGLWPKHDLRAGFAMTRERKAVIAKSARRATSNAHVDFIANEWFNAKQRRLAIVRLSDDGTVVERRGDGVEPSLLAGFPSLEAVVAKFNSGSYFFASEVHDEAECPWPENDLIRMKAVPLDGERESARRAT